MRTIATSVATLGLVAALGLSGCDGGGGSSDPQAPGSTGVAVPTAACSVVEGSPSPSAGSSTDDLGRVKGTVGLLLARTAGEAPHADTQALLLTNALERRGVHVDVATPRGRATFAARAQELIAGGATVLVVAAPDNASAVAVERAAAAAGVEVIDYGRLTLGGSAPYLVSFDAEAAGRLQARTLVDCLAQQGITDPRLMIVNGGTDVDNGAVLLDKGVHEVLDPLVADGRATIVSETTVKGWRLANAVPTFRVALEPIGERVDGVLAASDGIAQAVIRVLAHDGLDREVAVAGVGSGSQGLRHVVTGQQAMTVFEDPRAETDAAARLAVALLAGKGPAATGLEGEPFADPLSPGRRLTAVLLAGQAVTRANLKAVVGAGAVSPGDVCFGIADQCSALGLP